MYEQGQSEGKVWFLAAPSRGLGVEMARQLLAGGHSVVAADGEGLKALAQLPEAGERLQLLSVDLGDADQVEAAVEAAVRRFGRIDFLINNAYTAVVGAIEEAADSDIVRAVEANLLSLWRVTRAVLPVMRAQRHGHIINLSALSGAIRGPGWGLFNALQSAIGGMSDTLAEEAGPLGIGVTLVQPVPFRVDVPAGALIVAQTQIDDYYDTAGRARRRYGLPVTGSVSDPVTGVSAIIEAVTAAEPPRRLVLGHDSFYRSLKALEMQRDEQLAWQELSLAMDHVL